MKLQLTRYLKPLIELGKNKTARQLIIGLLIVSLALFFMKHEGAELIQIKATLSKSSMPWIFAGLIVTILYFTFFSLMYFYSFRSVNEKVSFYMCLKLYLKRNFISVFIPAGTITSLMFYNNDIEKKGVPKNKIYLASVIHTFISFLTILFVAAPVIIFLIFKNTIGNYEIYGFLGLLVILSLAGYGIYSILKKQSLYHFICRYYPNFEVIISDLSSHKINKKHFIITILFSSLVELCGIAHLYIAIAALGGTPTIEIASVGYVAMLMVMVVSPFMKGLGAVELGVTYLLTQYGFTSVLALSITLLFRLFEFWSTLFAGLIIFLGNAKKLFARFAPPLFIFLIGIINILSVLTPPVVSRLEKLKEFIHPDYIYLSNAIVLASGIILVFISPFLFKGMQAAWRIAVLFITLSIIGNLTKAFDYEEAIAGAIVLILMLRTRKSYFRHSRKIRLQKFALQSAFILIAVALYGTIGFYFMDKSHFGIAYSFPSAITEVFRTFFLLNIFDIHPITPLANHFILSLRILGTSALIFFVYTLLRPQIFILQLNETDKLKADILLTKYSNSSLDYFKTYFDKELFFADDDDAFLAYKTANDFALVLEIPVCADTNAMQKIIQEFDVFCVANNLTPAYYRVDESAIPLFDALGKRHIKIGQEAICDLTTFSLTGKEMQSFRNGVNKIEKSGYKFCVYNPPVSESVLQKISAVSYEWLAEDAKEEVIFSSGMFIKEELKKQTVITVENAEGKIVAFLNQQPNYNSYNEASYDMIRKTNDAPNGAVDYLMVKTFEYLKSQRFNYVNMGLAPLTGLDESKTTAEKGLHFIYENIKRYAHYHGLRKYKEKFNPIWKNKYLVYNEPYELLLISLALNKVIRNKD